MQTIRADAERVFREHNRVAGEVMLMLPELQAEDADTRRLVAADRAMLSACEALNEVAAARRDNIELTTRQRWRLPSTIDDCERQTDTVRQLLGQMERR